MIFVDVFAPLLNKSYDFCLDENTTVGAVLDEICGMICQKEHWPEVTSPRKMVLCCTQLGKILPVHKTLWNCGVQTGYRLVLT